MDGGDSPKGSLEKEKVVVVGPLSSFRIIDAPILLLVSFHKALRAELAYLHSLTSSSLEIGSLGRDLIFDLLRRFQFLKLAYKYHCAAEDEVIFQALDLQVGNVACTYSLEHRSIDDLFDLVFQSLNVLLEDDGNLFKPFQELGFCTNTIETSICFSFVDGAVLFQRTSFTYLAIHVECTNNVIRGFSALVDILSSYRRTGKVVVPKEKLLQEVMASWLGKQSQPSCRTLNARENEKGTSDSYEPLYLKELPKIYSSWKSFSGESRNQDNAKYHPIDGLRLWHSAIRKDLKEILEELHDIRNS